MREHPLLMKVPLVRATLEGRKTQTRRLLPDVFNSPPDLISGWLPPGEWKLFGATMGRWGAQWRGTYQRVPLLRVSGWVLCPFGRTGDRLWVRETHIRYPACPETGRREETIYQADGGHPDGYRWTPSIHMPRRVCRLVLPLVSVRVERVQDITEEDAKAEGLWRTENGWTDGATGYDVTNARAAFQELWTSIYGQESWDANPWVWVAEWKEIEVSK